MHLKFVSNQLGHRNNIVHKSGDPLNPEQKLFFSFLVENTAKRLHLVVLGKIPVLILHEIIEISECVWDRKPLEEVNY